MRTKKQSTIKHSDQFTQWAAQELGCQVIAEYQFHPKRRWRFDYALPQQRIALEVEGGVWTQGRHTRGSGFMGDMEKYNTASVMGWRVLRTTPDELMMGKTIRMLQAAVDAV